MIVTALRPGCVHVTTGLVASGSIVENRITSDVPGLTVVADGVTANAEARTARESTCVPRLEVTGSRAVYLPCGAYEPSASLPFQVHDRAPAASARFDQTVRTSVPSAS